MIKKILFIYLILSLNQSVYSAETLCKTKDDYINHTFELEYDDGDLHERDFFKIILSDDSLGELQDHTYNVTYDISWTLECEHSDNIIKFTSDTWKNYFKLKFDFNTMSGSEEKFRKNNNEFVDSLKINIRGIDGEVINYESYRDYGLPIFKFSEIKILETTENGTSIWEIKLRKDTEIRDIYLKNKSDIIKEGKGSILIDGNPNPKDKWHWNATLGSYYIEATSEFEGIVFYDSMTAQTHNVVFQFDFENKNGKIFYEFINDRKQTNFEILELKEMEKQLTF